MGHLLDAVQRTDVVEGVNARRQASVKTEDLIIDKCCKRKEIEQVCEKSLSRVSSLRLLIERTSRESESLTSRHSHFRIYANTRRRNRTLA